MDPRKPPAPEGPQYDPGLLLAIRQARSDLYDAQAERRRQMLLTRTWQPPKERELSPVQAARSNLDAARQMARDTAATPKGDDDADL